MKKWWNYFKNRKSDKENQEAVPEQDIRFMESVMNWVLPGLQLFYRDTDLDVDLDKLAAAYSNRKIIRAGFFIDCTSKAAKPVKRIRFIIASAHAAALWENTFDPEMIQWRLNVLDYNSYFRVVDTYRVGNQLQICLLHIPLKGIHLFTGMENINFGENLDLVKIARCSFDEKSKMESFPWLETEEWNERTEMLPGMTVNGWQSLEPVSPPNEKVAEIHELVMSLSHDETDLNKID